MNVTLYLIRNEDGTLTLKEMDCVDQNGISIKYYIFAMILMSAILIFIIQCMMYFSTYLFLSMLSMNLINKGV